MYVFSLYVWETLDEAFGEKRQGIKKLDVSMYVATGSSTDMEYPPRPILCTRNFSSRAAIPAVAISFRMIRYDNINIVLFKLL